MKHYLLLFTLMLTACAAEAQEPPFTVVERARQLNIPWEMVWGPDDFIWYTERAGRVGKLNTTTWEKKTIATIPEVHSTGESGLLGMALDPQFPTLPYIYLAYTYTDGAMRERIVRYTVSNDALIEPRVLLEGISAATIHDGCRITFAPDQTMFVSTGDAGNAAMSQMDNTRNGKILHTTRDGEIPPDNPWPGSYVWSKGHRNPQGLRFAPNGTLYSSEHGPDRDDEINIIEKGRNYGWPTVNGFCDNANEQKFCADSNVVEPLHSWTPPIATSSILYYTGTRIAAWTNTLLLLSLRDESIQSIRFAEDGRTITQRVRYYLPNQLPVETRIGRMRAICTSPDGRIFISSSFSNNTTTFDRIVELVPTASVDESIKRLKVHPNPTSGKLMIEGLENPSHAGVLDVLGKSMGSFELSGSTLDISSLAAGVYWLSIEDSGAEHHVKFVKE